MRRTFLLGLIATLSLFAEVPSQEPYYFSGRHFLASYLGCDADAMGDIEGMLSAMDKAVSASHATILERSHYVFEPNGLTAAYLLSESHASIHTYPEWGACFVDIFTCGDTCIPENLDAVLRDYLKPAEVSSRLLLRSETIEEVDYPSTP